MCALPTRACASARPRPRTAISTSRPSSPPARSPAPTRCIRATASSPRMPASPRSSKSTTSPSSGPTAEHVRLMGDKIEAKATARDARHPRGAGLEARSTISRRPRALARDIGYPVLVKAAAGGGGRGMKLALTENELEPALQTARNEAQGRLRRRHRLSREIPRPSPPYRGAGARRRPGQRHPSRRARLLAATPPPEALGGGPLARAQRRASASASARPWPRPCASWAIAASARSSSSMRTASSTSSR